MTGKRILFSYRFFTLGGVEMVIRNRMAILQQKGYDTRVLFSLDYGGMSSFTGMEDRVLVCKDEQERGEFIRSFDPDWVVVFDQPEGIELANRYAPRARQIYEVHTTVLGNLAPLREKGLFANLSAFVTPSEQQMELIHSLLPTSIPVFVVPNGVDQEFWEDLPGISENQDPIVAWVGRLEAHKNWLGYLRLVERLAVNLPQANFWMVGGQASTLQQHQVLWLTLRKRNLETRFRWFPEVPPQNMPAFFQAVARSGGCFVSTSKGESFGLAALEAMASGCPVVAPSTGGLEEIIADGENGLLYPPGKLKEAASLIQGLLTDRKSQQKMGENARSFARRYSSAASVETFMRVLDKLEEQDHR